MKKLVITLVFLVLTIPLAQAQEEPPSKRPLRIGGAGGYMPMWIMPNLDDVNQRLSLLRLPKFSTGGFYASGGGGYAYIIFIPNVRIGGYGAGGSIKTDGVIFEKPTKVEYSVSFGGATVEYALPVFDRASVVLGTMLGGGGIELAILQSDRASSQWGEVWSRVGLGLPPENYKQKLSTGFFVYNPYIYFEYGITSFFGFRIGAGYIGNTSGDWKVDDNSDLVGVPSGVKLNGLLIQAGIFAGFFPD